MRGLCKGLAVGLVLFGGMQRIVRGGVQEDFTAAAGKTNIAARIAALKEVAANPAATPALEGRCLFGIACSRALSSDWDGAMEDANKALALLPADGKGPLVADAWFLIGNCRVALNQHEDAITCFRKVFAEAPATWIYSGNGQSESRRKLQLLIGKSYVALKQYEQAAAELMKVSSIPNGFVWDSTSSLVLAAQCYAELSKHAEAVQALTAALKITDNAGIVAIKVPLLKYVALIQDADALKECEWQLRGAVMARVETPEVCEMLQFLVVEVLLSEGKYEEALFEAKCLVNTCSAGNLKAATEFLARGLKAQDGSVARVNKFFEFQKYGKAGSDRQAGTADDLADPLASVTDPHPQEREALLAGTLKTIPADWKGRMVRANLFWYAGKPKESLKELKTALAICPVEQKVLQQITDRITVALINVSGNRAAAEQFVDFQKYGPDGADGKAGTADDLKNPLLEYTK